MVMQIIEVWVEGWSREKIEDKTNSHVSRIYKSLRGFIPSVPPNTNRLSPTVVQL